MLWNCDSGSAHPSQPIAAPRSGAVPPSRPSSVLRALVSPAFVGYDTIRTTRRTALHYINRINVG